MQPYSDKKLTKPKGMSRMTWFYLTKDLGWARYRRKQGRMYRITEKCTRRVLPSFEKLEYAKEQRTGWGDTAVEVTYAKEFSGQIIRR